MKKFNLFLTICFILCLFSLYQIRMKVFWLFLLVLIIAIIKKYKKTVHLCTIYCIVLLALYIYPLHESIEQIRFLCVKQAYTKEAERIIGMKKNKVDSDAKREEIKVPLFYTQNNKALIYRNDKNLSVYFPTRVTFFNSSGFVYCKNKLELNHNVNREKNDTLLALHGYDKIKMIDEHWAYVKIY